MLAVGDTAPDFTLPNQHREVVRLASHRGSPVLLVFFPRAFTAVCAGELRALRERPPQSAGQPLAVLGISCDPVPSLRVFAHQEQLDLPLLSDFWPHGATAREYGVFDETAGVALRASFLLDAAGVVRWRTRSGDDARDHAAYQAAVDEH